MIRQFEKFWDMIFKDRDRMFFKLQIAEARRFGNFEKARFYQMLLDDLDGEMPDFFDGNGIEYKPQRGVDMFEENGRNGLRAASGIINGGLLGLLLWILIILVFAL